MLTLESLKSKFGFMTWVLNSLHGLSLTIVSSVNGNITSGTKI